MPAVDFVQIALEENPIYEGAVAVPTTGPNRIANEKLYLPGRSAVIRPNTNYKRRDDEFRSILGTVPVILDHYEPDGALSEYAYYDNLIWLLLLCGFTATITPGGATVADPDTTTVVGVNALNSATLNVTDTTLFPASGSFILGGAAVTYTGKTATSFTGVGTHAATTGGETVANVVPATATKWVFTKRTGIVAQTAQILVNYADEGYQMKGNGFGVSQIALNGDGELSASLVGLVCKRAAVDTTTVPAYTTQAVPPVRRGDLYLSFLAGGGAIADFGWTLDNPLAAIRSMSLLPPSNFPDTLEFGDAQAKLTGTIPKRIATAVDQDAAMAATTFSARARYKSSKTIAATSYAYSMWIELPAAQYTAGTIEDLKNVRRHGIPDLAFEGNYDETAGFDCRITIVGGTSSVATYP
jgi:hypothetical protein